MKSKLLLCCSVLGFIAATVIDASGADVQPYAIPGRYIVVLKHGHQPADVAAKHGLKTRHVFGHALHGFAGEISDARLEALRHDPRVEFIEPELELFTSAQTLPTGVKRIGANLSPLAKIDGLDERINADIAILDTGIAPHPDLNIYTNVSFIAGQTTDGNGHGTHVAGIAAAIDNGVGVVGVAPGARLWAIKVMDNTGAGTTASVIQGIDFVTQNAGQIEVANLSFGGIGYSSAMRLAISNSVAKGIVFVVSAGNDGRDIYGPDGVQNTADDSIPAAYPEVMTVSALYDLDGLASSDDALASFSNYSRNVAGSPVTSPGAAIDLAAPGLNIASTYLNSGYATMSGTSMASPHAAGAAALYIAAHSRATNAAGVYAIRQALINSAQPQSAWGSTNTQDPDGNREGLVYVASIAPPANNNPPVVTITSPISNSTFPYNASIQFTATASDVEDGNLTTKLVWMSNVIWQIGTGGSFSVTLVPGTHTVVVSVTDSGGKTGSATVVVNVNPNSVPVVSITSPGASSSVVTGTAITFAGSATDAESGNLTANLVWTSSINGQIGTGGSFSTSSLSAGTHTIVARATDSGSATGQKSITITVGSAQPPPTSTLSVSVATDKPSYVNRSKATITATVTSGGSPVSGATAHMEVVTPKGNLVTSDATTDANGIARFQYTINANRGTGTYSVKMTASKAGATAGSGTTTFSVTR